MRWRILFLLACIPALASGAVHSPEGRWEGTVDIPGQRLQLVVDLAEDNAGAWTGSIIVPSLGIKGAPLSKVVVTSVGVSFDTGSALSNATYGPAAFRAELPASDAMAGEMRQGGNVARFALQKTGAAQVEPAARSTPVGREIENEWIGEFELGGYPRRVTITLENHADAAATAKFVIVGKQTTNLPVDLVVEEGTLLRVESQANRVAFEGRVSRESGEIKGVIELGPVELPLVLRRAAGSNS